MSNRKATLQEREECKQIYRGVLEIMDGKDYDAILNTLCFIVAELGVDLEVSKQKFVAQVVEQVSSAYDMHKLLGAKPQGEA